MSVDPIAEDYPHLSSFNYASNRPFTSIDAEGLQTPDEPKPVESANGEELPKLNNSQNSSTLPPSSAQELMKSTPEIDMTNAPNPTSFTAEGAPRDKTYFWNEHQKIEPHSLSKRNLYLVNELGLSPEVDDTWLKYHPEHSAYKGEVLHHHHKDQGKMATAVPAKAHYDFFSELHPKLRSKIQGAIKGVSVKGIASQLPSILGEIGDLAALLNRNPDNFYWSLFPPTPKEGQVQFDADNLLYFTPIKINLSYWEDGETIKSVDMIMNYYTGFVWDEDKSQYVGVDYKNTERVYFEYDKSGRLVSGGKMF